MIYQTLGNSELEVSALSLGCMSFHTLEQAKPIIAAALAAGINFFDTADLYDMGENERVVGQLLAERRQDIIIATKVGNRWRNDGSAWDWVPKKAYILTAVEESLSRLQTDYIDLYQLHGGTIDDPLEEVVEAFELLQEQGKIRAYGISSIRPNTIRKWTTVGQGHSCMMQYSMLDRRPEEEALDHLASARQSVIVRGALAKGLLAGKAARAYLGHSEEEVQEVQKVLQGKGSLAGLAVAYALAHPAVASLVLGASTAKQLEEVVTAWEGLDTARFDLKYWQKELPLARYEAHR